MGLGHGADIVRNGLVLHLDAANVKSYPGKLGQELVTNSLITKKDGVTFNVLRTPTENITLTLGSVVAGKNYIITYNITSYTGSVGATVRINGSGANLTPGIGISSVGTFTTTFNALVSGSLSINGDNTGTNFNVDFVSVKEMLENTGTSWNDLSGNGNNGTLVNGIAYNTDNNGSMVFDGTNDYVNCGNIIQGRTTFSAVSWINSTDLRTGSNGTYMNPSIFGTQHGGGVSGDFALTLKNGYIGFYHELNSSGQINTTKLVSDGLWHMVSVTKTTLGVIKLFVDSTEVYSGTGFTSSLRTTDLQFYNWELGRAYWIGEDASMLRYNGKMSNHIFYNRALSATEIQQNFEATRGRYGI